MVIAFSVADLATTTYSLTPDSPDSVSKAVGSYNNSLILHYNLRTGYLNFTTGGKNQISYFYFIYPFNGLNPVAVRSTNNSSEPVAVDLLFLNIYQVNTNGTSNLGRTAFGVTHISLVSPQTPSLEKDVTRHFLLSSNSLQVDLEPFSFSGGLSREFGNSPGYHTFFLNFTLTIYSTFGPFKMPIQSQSAHLEYNNTIVE